MDWKVVCNYWSVLWLVACSVPRFGFSRATLCVLIELAPNNAQHAINACVVVYSLTHARHVETRPFNVSAARPMRMRNYFQGV